MTDNSGIIVIHGKEYKIVAKRVAEFREIYPDWTISSELLSSADLVQIKTSILNPEGRLVATGFAEENRDQGNINKTSAVENCETSAVGRALSWLNFGGTEIASAEEVQRALDQQKELESLGTLMEHNRAVRDHIESIVATKAYLINEQYDEAYACMEEVHPEDKLLLWRAPSKGGIWSTDERAKMKSNEWTEARINFHKDNEDE